MAIVSSKLLTLLLFPTLITAFSWQFQNSPAQCQNASITLDGSGQPPYSILLVPVGPSPLANNIEVRTIVNIPIRGCGARLSAYVTNIIHLTYHDAQVSDSSAFGSGGTSIAAQVLSSDDTTCFNASASVNPDFVFSIDPPNQIVQCSPTRLWWDNTTVQGYATYC
jgi:hypothetical protein